FIFFRFEDQRGSCSGCGSSLFRLGRSCPLSFGRGCGLSSWGLGGLGWGDPQQHGCYREGIQYLDEESWHAILSHCLEVLGNPPPLPRKRPLFSGNQSHRGLVSTSKWLGRGVLTWQEAFL